MRLAWSDPDAWCHASAWFGLIFATPLLIALSNQQDLSISLPLLAAGLLVLFLLLTFAGWGMSGRLGPRFRKMIAAGMLALAVVLAIQGNVIHTLTDFGHFDGTPVDFRKYGSLFWIEWYGYLAGFFLLFIFLSRASLIPAWLPWLPIASFTLALVPALLSPGAQFVGLKSVEFDDTVYEFSRSRNLIHLLPDSLQSDVVEQVFRENPELAEQFRGFTLYVDNLGLYYGTAPTLPALLTGMPFDFEKGHTYDWITPHIDEHSYQSDLAELGFELDLVPIAQAYCVSAARSCVPRPFSGWKSWGYERQRADSAIYSLKVLADLTFYRLTPAFLKEKIHRRGEWMFAGSGLDGASPWPDPVIREWTENMRVTDGPAHYKFYHYIGTHKPPFWSRDCRRQGSLTRSRENFLGQAYCVLNSIAALLEKLEEEGIHDQTAMIISGDHGHDTKPGDIQDSPQSVMLSEEMMGTARPALLVKRMTDREPLKISRMPTSLIDVAPLARSMSKKGVGSNFKKGVGSNFRHGKVDLQLNPLLEIGSDPLFGRDRFYYDYPVEKVARWTPDPIPYDTYRVRGPANLNSSWELLDRSIDAPAPREYPLISYETASGLVHGLRLNSAQADQEHAWIIRKQLAFLISMPAPLPDQTSLVLNLHIPEWIGEQTFMARVNQSELETQYQISAAEKFWQEVKIPLPHSALREGNNFVSLKFDSLQLSPNGNVTAAALLRSIHTE